MKANDRVIEVGSQSGLHNLHQAFWLVLAIDDDVGAKEPMAAVLAVALCHVKELHIGWVSPQVVLKQGSVVLEVPVIKCKTKLLQKSHFVTRLEMSQASWCHHPDDVTSLQSSQLIACTDVIHTRDVDNVGSLP